MGKKKAAHNSFYYFMIEFSKRQGRSFKNMAEVAAAAGPHWTKMSKEERRPYEEMAKRFKEKKQTNIGESIDLLYEEDQLRLAQEESMKKDIETTISSAVRSGSIAETRFYLMHVNDFCFCQNNKRHYPAEIALGSFNLRDGVNTSDVYHSIIHPGPFPLGYSHEAKRTSEETHLIPPNFDSNAVENTFEVFEGVLNYMNARNDEAGAYPPIYVLEKDIPLVESVLEHMSNTYECSNVFKVYPLQYMFYILRNSVSKSSDKIWPTISLSYLELEKDVFDFCKGIACEYHENLDALVHCSRSRVIRLAYIICDNCTQDLGIPIHSGHVPLKSNAQIQALLQSTSNSYSENASQARSVYDTAAESFSSAQTDFDTKSEISTVVDESDFSDYKGFDTESDASEWQSVTRRSHRGTSMASAQTHDDFTSALSQASSSSGYLPARRPMTASAASLYQPGSSGNRRPNIGKGRGRGITKLNQVK